MKKDRKTVLLKAAYDILKKCSDSHFVISPMEVTTFYDDADCDGFCLMEDIKDELDSRKKMWTNESDNNFPVLEKEVKIGRYPTAPQLKKLAVALFRGETLTPSVAHIKYGCLRLSERMRELKELGWGIQKKRIETGSGAHVMSYFL